MALIPEPSIPASTPLDQQPASEFQFREPTADDLALGLVVQDKNRAESWLESRSWLRIWDAAQLFFEFTVPPDQIKMWPGTKQPRAHLMIPVLLPIVESMLAPIVR